MSARALSTTTAPVWISTVTPRVIEDVMADPDAWEYIAKAAVEQRDARKFGSPDWSLLNRLYLVAAEISESGACVGRPAWEPTIVGTPQHQPAGAGTTSLTREHS